MVKMMSVFCLTLLKTMLKTSGVFSPLSIYRAEM